MFLSFAAASQKHFGIFFLVFMRFVAALKQGSVGAPGEAVAHATFDKFVS